MNRMEHFFCSTSLWQRMTQRYLLPWVLADARIGDHVLEIGAGYGAATTFSSAIAILVLHHLKSRELQDRAIAEVHRVLRPGGSFFVFEIEDGWMERIAHYRSTFTPVAAGSAFARLNKAGFSKISVDFRRGGYRFRARKAPAACVDENERALAASATA